MNWPMKVSQLSNKLNQVPIQPEMRRPSLHGGGRAPGRQDRDHRRWADHRPGHPRTLGGRDTSAARITFTLPAHTYAHELPATLVERVEEQPGGRLALASASVATDLHAISGWALERGEELEDLEVHRPTLEDTYLALTARHQRS
jgi:hypothetical protein